MNNNIIRRDLIHYTKQHRKAVWVKDELRVVFGKNCEATFNQALAALIRDGSLVRLNRGVFYQPSHPHLPVRTLIGQAVRALRCRHHNYLSLEAVLFDHGRMDEAPAALTFMTTGRSGTMETPIGRFEFIHTARSIQDILDGVYQHPDFWCATQETARRDLARIGRLPKILTPDQMYKPYAHKGVP